MRFANLLPQEIAPVDSAQTELTQRFLLREREALEEYFLQLRGETDAKLSGILGAIADNPYPFGRCEEITSDVAGRMAKYINHRHHCAEQAIYDFAAAGGIIRRVWGELRGLYFQNAMQFGGLYVDVANDSVVVSKPKIEILPLQESGLQSIRDPEHFASIAQTYWGAAVYANHAIPALAPLLPMISVRPDGKSRLQSACDYMIDLMRQDGFRQAENWLRYGPAPNKEIVTAMVERAPFDLRPLTSDGRAESIIACRRTRRAGLHRDVHWRNARVADFLRLHAV